MSSIGKGNDGPLSGITEGSITQAIIGSAIGFFTWWALQRVTGKDPAPPSNRIPSQPITPSGPATVIIAEAYDDSAIPVVEKPSSAPIIKSYW